VFVRRNRPEKMRELRLLAAAVPKSWRDVSPEAGRPHEARTIRARRTPG
jgi:hypothetical protein